MAERKLIVKSADQTRSAEISLDDGSTGAEVLQAAVDNWALPANMDYTLVNATTGRVLVPATTLDNQVKDGDVLEVQPVLVAGCR
jgi:hypothetical protein